jgi:hypothetical protein
MKTICLAPALTAASMAAGRSMNGIAVAIAIVASTIQHPDLAFFGSSRLLLHRSRARRHGQPSSGRREPP